MHNRGHARHRVTTASDLIDVDQPALVDLSSACLDYLTWMSRDRGAPDNTIRSYRAALLSLASVAGDPAYADQEAVETWWSTRLDDAPATRTQRLAAIRSFYKWATRFDVRADDPTRRLTAPKIGKRVPRPIGEADVDRLLGELTADRPEDRRAIALMNYGGLRIAEAAALDWTQIDVDGRRIYVLGKGDKERVISLSPLLLDKLLPATGGNVVNAGRAPTRPRTLEARINALMERNGIDHTCHDFRKRGATLAIARTGDIYAVAKFFGWASIETASHYALVGDEALDRIAAAMM